MTKVRLLSGLLVAASLALGGCVLRGSGGLYVRPAAVVVVEDAPPPPRVEYYDARPGQIWIQGRWYRQGNRWDWHGGRWERERVGYVYAPGQWEQRGGGHVWVDGRWSAGGRQHIRVDNRNKRNNDKGNNNGRVIVRDHRR